jgi:hypothetical protein
MNENKSIADTFQDSVNEFWTIIGSYLPKLIGALLLIVVAAFVAKLAQAAVVKGLELIGVNKLVKNKNVTRSLKTADINVDFVDVTGRIVFWVVIVIFALTIAEVLGLNAMSEVMTSLLGYLPSVLAAAIVLTVTVAGARLVRDVMAAALYRMSIDYAHGISNITFFVLLVFGSLMALDQLGFDTTILTANITIIVAGIVLALSLAFGLGGRDLAGRLLDQGYSNIRKNHKK